jgi:hypothetical protein
MKLTPTEVLADGTWIAEICKKSVQGGKTHILLDDIGDILDHPGFLGGRSFWEG